MAVVVVALGLPVSLLFQVFVPEDSTAGRRTVKLKWYKWFVNPRFYLVSYGITTAYVPMVTALYKV